MASSADTLIKLTDEQETKQDEVLCKLGCDLDGRFSSVRTAETNLGNLLSDIMLAALQADCAILNAGTVRSNVKHPKGEFKLRVSSGSDGLHPRNGLSAVYGGKLVRKVLKSLSLKSDHRPANNTQFGILMFPP